MDWRPDRDDQPGIVVRAFAERGKRASIPGPLIRVPEGTTIVARVTNPRTSGTLVVRGLSTRGSAGGRDTVQIAAGATRELRFTAGTPGSYYYSGQIVGEKSADSLSTPDAELHGAFVVDARGTRRANDRVLVIGLWTKTLRPGGQVSRDDVLRFTINGKAWPQHRAADVHRRRHGALSRHQREHRGAPDAPARLLLRRERPRRRRRRQHVRRRDVGAARGDRARRRRPHVLDDVGPGAFGQLAVPLPRQLPRPPERAARRQRAAARAPGAREQPRAGHDGRAGDGNRGARARHASRGAGGGDRASAASARDAAGLRRERRGARVRLRAARGQLGDAGLVAAAARTDDRARAREAGEHHRGEPPARADGGALARHRAGELLRRRGGLQRPWRHGSRRRSRRATRSWRGSRRRGRGRSCITRTPTRRASSRRG